MALLQRHIDDLEAQAALSWRLAKLMTDPERRTHGARLCCELRLLAKQLRSPPERPQTETPGSLSEGIADA